MPSSNVPHSSSDPRHRPSDENPDATHDYADIINLPRPRSSRPPMSLESRAAQFAPFAALSEATPPDPDSSSL